MNTNAFFDTRSTTPRNSLLFADRQLNRDHRAAARFAQRRQRAFEAGAFAVEPVDDDQARQAELARAAVPDFLGLDHDAGDRVDHHQRGVGDVQRGERVG